MMKIKNTKSPMKHNKTAKARLRGARPVCFDGRFAGYKGKNFPGAEGRGQTSQTWPGGAGAHLSIE